EHALAAGPAQVELVPCSQHRRIVPGELARVPGGLAAEQDRERLAETEQVALREPDRPVARAAARLEVDLGPGGPEVPGLDHHVDRVGVAGRGDPPRLEEVERAQVPPALAGQPLAPG